MNGFATLPAIIPSSTNEFVGLASANEFVGIASIFLEFFIPFPPSEALRLSARSAAAFRP